MKSQKEKVLAWFFLLTIVPVFICLLWLVVGSRMAANKLIEGEVWEINGDLDRTEVVISGRVDHWFIRRHVYPKSFPEGIKPRDKVKLIPLGSNDFAIEKIPNQAK